MAAIESDCVVNPPSKLLDSTELLKLLDESQNVTTNCDKNTTMEHELCFTQLNNLMIPQCSHAFVTTLIKLLSSQPSIFDDEVKERVLKYYQNNNIKAQDYISLNVLSLLDKTSTPTLTWLKYEAIMIHLIKRQVYEPKRVANELLATVKEEIPESVSRKFASVLQSCVKYCREANKSRQDEEEEEKWCEIIDWMSWFIGE